MDSDKAVPVQSVRRALEALDRLALAGLRGEAVSLQQVAEHLGVAATTAHNIIKTLATCGYVQREERGYGLGPRCADLARSARFGGGWLERAAAVVHQLAERTGESVVLATLLHGHRQVLARVEGSAVVRVGPAVEAGDPFYEMVTGRVLAAYASPAELDQILAVHGLPGAAWEQLRSRDDLTAALAALRAEGAAWAETSGGEVTALAVPVINHQGDLLATLGTYLPSFRATPSHRAALRQELMGGAERIAETD